MAKAKLYAASGEFKNEIDQPERVIVESASDIVVSSLCKWLILMVTTSVRELPRPRPVLKSAAVRQSPGSKREPVALALVRILLPCGFVVTRLMVRNPMTTSKR